jgi:Helix-turn-helix domain
MATSQLKSLELKIEKLTQVLEQAISRGVFSGAADDVPLNTVQAANFLGMRPGTLSIWRSQNEGPPYHLSGTSPRYFRKDLDEWLRLTKPKRKVSSRVGRPAGRGKVRREAGRS